NAAPFAGRLDRGAPGVVVTRTVDSAFDAGSACEIEHLLDVFGAGLEHRVAESLGASDLHPLRDHVDADDLAGAESPAEHRGGQADWSQAGDEHGIVAADPDLFQAFVHGAEAAGDLRSVEVGQLVRKQAEVLFFGEEVFGHAAIALPAIGAAVLLAGAGN